MDADQFNAHVDGINTAGFTSLLFALGKDLGLFDVMIERNKPMTSQEVAGVAGMKEWYVRELLSGAAAGSLVSYNANRKTLFIPEAHHATFRTRASWTGGVVAMATRTSEVKCFMKDGPHGFDYSLPFGLWDFFPSYRVYSSVDIVDECIIPSLTETDVGRKLGEISLEFAKYFSKSIFKGLEYFEKSLSLATENIKKSGVTNFILCRGNVLDLPEEITSSYYVVTMIDALHDLPDPQKALAGIHRVLKPDGTLLLQEFTMSSELKDNIGNMAVAMFFACSLHVCLPSSLSLEPRAGFGLCWGRQNIEAAIREKFTINHVISGADEQPLCMLKINPLKEIRPNMLIDYKCVYVTPNR